MIDLKQKELNEWQVSQKEKLGESTVEDMVIGMTEEVGELCHWILKRKQGIREGASGSLLKEEIADAFADAIIPEETKGK